MSIGFHVNKFSSIYPSGYEFGQDKALDARYVQRAIGGVNTEDDVEMYVFDAQYSGKQISIVGSFIGEGVGQSELCGALEYAVRRILESDTTSTTDEERMAHLSSVLQGSGAVELPFSHILDVSNWQSAM